MKVNFIEKKLNSLSHDFLTNNMFSVNKNKPLNSFFSGLYKYCSFLRLYCETVLNTAPFIYALGDANVGQIACGLNLENDAYMFYNLLKKNNLCGDEWLFFGPKFSLKEYAHCENISELK